MLLTLAAAHHERWTRSEQLLAGIVDSLGHVAYLLELQLASQAKNPKQAMQKVKKPEPLDRPGVSSRRRGSTLGEMKRGGRGG